MVLCPSLGYQKIKILYQTSTTVTYLSTYIIIVVDYINIVVKNKADFTKFRDISTVAILSATSLSQNVCGLSHSSPDFCYFSSEKKPF